MASAISMTTRSAPPVSSLGSTWRIVMGRSIMAGALPWFGAEGENAVAITYRVPEVALAYEMLEGDGPVVVFCPGFASDMGGTKAMRLWAWCEAHGQAMLRFDYSGHGQSGGRFIGKEEPAAPAAPGGLRCSWRAKLGRGWQRWC